MYRDIFVSIIQTPVILVGGKFQVALLPFRAQSLPPPWRHSLPISGKPPPLRPICADLGGGGLVRVGRDNELGGAKEQDLPGRVDQEAVGDMEGCPGIRSIIWYKLC